MKYTLISANATRNPHNGLMVTAYYKQDPSNPLEVPQRLVVFNRWPNVEIEADVVEYKLNGVYKYPNGKRTSSVVAFSPKTKDGNYLMGYSPEEIIAKRLNVLVKVED